MIKLTASIVLGFLGSAAVSGCGCGDRALDLVSGTPVTFGAMVREAGATLATPLSQRTLFPTMDYCGHASQGLIESVAKVLERSRGIAPCHFAILETRVPASADRELAAMVSRPGPSGVSDAGAQLVRHTDHLGRGTVVIGGPQADVEELCALYLMLDQEHLWPLRSHNGISVVEPLRSEVERRWGLEALQGGTVADWLSGDVVRSGAARVRYAVAERRVWIWHAEDLSCFHVSGSSTAYGCPFCGCDLVVDGVCPDCSARVDGR